jgi:acetyl esterase
MNNKTLDSEVIEFIETYLRVSDGMAISNNIEQMRASYEQICRQFHSPRPASVTTEDDEVNGRHGSIKTRHYSYQKQTESAARIVFIHGGGCVIGSLDSHDDICAELCDATGFNAVSIDYRLSPEYFHPVHLDDVEDAFSACWHSNSILLGMSSGGTLAAALSHRLKFKEQRAKGQVLIYPGLGGDLIEDDLHQLPAYRDNADAPLLTTKDYLFYRQQRCAEDDLPRDDPEFYPLLANDFSELPPTITFSADVDPLRDDARVYVEKINAAGGHAEYTNEAGLVHDYLRARHSSAKAADSFLRICKAVLKLAG